MRRTRALRVALAGLLLFATLPAAVAAGGQAVGSASLEGVLLDHLGLLPEQVDRWRDALVDVDGEFITFARGGDASVPPGDSLEDLPWAEPLALGFNLVQWQDPDRIPHFGAFEVVDGVLTGSVGNGPRVGPAYVVMTAVLAADIPLDSGEPQQWDFVLQIPGLDQWEALPQFPDDTWNGGSFVLSLRTDGDGWSLEFVLFPNGEITRRSFPGFGIISGDTLIIGVEADPSVFDAAAAQGAPGGSGPSGLIAGQPLGALQSVKLEGTAVRLALDTLRLVLAAPRTGTAFFLYALFAPYPAMLVSESTGVTVTSQPDPTTTMGVTATTSAATAPPVAGDGGGISLLLILLLIALLLLLLWLLWRWYASRTEKSKDIYRFGPTRERGRPSGGGGEDDDDDDPRDTPPPVVYGEEIEEHGACAWGLYFHDGTREIAIREPEIHEHLCCKYVVRVATNVTAHAQAARGRQDAGADRLRIPDFDYAWRWVDLVANTSTRSGPAGRLDWMQGLGDPTDQSTPLDPYWQDGPEPPEVAAHLTHRERTGIDITLEPGCPEYENLYTVSAKSQLELLATHECTNDAGDPCPVELNAFGFFGGWIIGPGNIFCGASDWTGSDPDELERSPLAEERIRAGGKPHTPSDAHDHVERDRVVYQVSESDRASDALEQDDLSISIENDVELDAGQGVPIAVYPTTERVSTHIEGDLKHDLLIQVNLTPIDCEKNNCGGHGLCACEAQWTMQVSGASGSWIDAGGGPFEILREPTAADRRAPFTGKRSWTGKT